MRPFIAAAILTLFAARPLDGQASAGPTSSATRDAEREVRDAVARLDSALARRDRAALEVLVADPFTWVHASDGRLDGRAGWLENAARGAALTGQRVSRTLHGATVALHGMPTSHTALWSARVQLRDTARARESWLRQTQVWVRGADGAWRLALGQGTLLYEGPAQDTALLARYAGTYTIAPGRTLTLAWREGGLFATLPNGATGQIFLASPTEEAVRTSGQGQLRFTLGPDGRPASVALVRGSQELWRAARAP